MYKNYLIDYNLRSIKNHTLTSCKIQNIKINSMNNQLISQQKDIWQILINLRICFNQYPAINKAKKSNSVFNVKKNNIIGSKIDIKKTQILSFLKNFIFSILPNKKIIQTIKIQNINKHLFVLNYGFNNLFFWWEIKNNKTAGFYIQFIIKQLAKEKDFLYFLSKYNIKIK